MKKHNYTIRELINNGSLQRILDGTASKEEIYYWNKWMEASESNRQKLQQAMTAILGFKFSESKDTEIEKEWDRLYDRTVNKTKKYTRVSSQANSSYSWIYRAVAAVLLIGALGSGIYWQGLSWQEIPDRANEITQVSMRKTVSTNANERKTIRFTNEGKEAKIVMNSNSSITYDVGLQKNQTNNITMRGEVFFDVEKGFSNTNTFSVTTPKGLIEDIGTKFMVNVSEQFTRVVLQDGLVIVRTKQDEANLKELEVAKGEKVEFNGQDIETKTKVNPTFYTSWATGRVEFDKTKISEFAQFIENRFGVTVKIENPEIADMTIDGAAYFESLDELVRSVTDVMEISLHHSTSRDTIFIGPHNGKYEN